MKLKIIPIKIKKKLESIKLTCQTYDMNYKIEIII